MARTSPLVGTGSCAGVAEFRCFVAWVSSGLSAGVLASGAALRDAVELVREADLPVVVDVEIALGLEGAGEASKPLGSLRLNLDWSLASAVAAAVFASVNHCPNEFCASDANPEVNF